MPGRVGFEALLPLNRPLDFFGRNLSLLDDPVRYDCSYSPVKEVQDPVLHMLEAQPQFVDPIPQIVPFRSAKFVT